VVLQRVRIRFCKQGDLRLIGHRDLARCFERWFRRAGLKLRMSEGFHPKPRISFPSALAVGIAGIDEVMELELVETCLAEELQEQLSGHAPPGLSINAIEVLPPASPKARVRSFRYEVPLPDACRDGLAERIEQLASSASWSIHRSNRQTPIDLRQWLEELTLREGVLYMRLRTAAQATAGPRDVLAALGLGDLEKEGVCLTRTAVELQP
jgi:radical SAM-linked protein